METYEKFIERLESDEKKLSKFSVDELNFMKISNEVNYERLSLALKFFSSAVFYLLLCTILFSLTLLNHWFIVTISGITTFIILLLLIFCNFKRNKSYRERHVLEYIIEKRKIKNFEN